LIPNVIHFCFGLSPDQGGKPFSLVHYLAVRSAVETNRPEAVRFYYRYEPSGEWWERARPFLDLHPVEPMAALYGVPDPHYAHQADFLRLAVLEEHGGIYLDMDVLCLRSFEPLRRHETVLGEEGKHRAYGLCNAVILSAPGSWFVRNWLEGYDPATSRWRGFRSTGRDAHWNELSVRYPAYLARLYPDRLHVVDHRAFFWPTWTDEDLHLLYRGTGTSFAESYCVHLWEQVAWEPYLKDLDVDFIRSVDNNFNRLARRFLDF
jgi:hypothetical protein